VFGSEGGHPTPKGLKKKVLVGLDYRAKRLRKKHIADLEQLCVRISTKTPISSAPQILNV